MQDLDKALTDISAIRSQMARGTMFRGYGPAALSATGILGAVAAVIQSFTIERPLEDVSAYLALWTATAGISVVFIAIEAIRRSRQVHGGLADDMLRAAVEQFLPAAAAGALLTVVLWLTAPAEAWMLPGLWQIMFSLGAFGSCRSLPRPMIAVGVWYLGTGLLSLAFATGPSALSPWVMGFPFGVGQCLAAWLLHTSYGDVDETE